ncbi:sorting nexin-15 isoform X2 [Anolis carolinensis]|uniref:sorting nexin-15 isoform X2 n=1 Tax=Anolis carolinensis TaxID=28377 RepID=UPI002F2B7280
MSRRAKEEYQRFYTVTEPRTHPKGHTEYKVTAKFISKVNPEDVKEIVVWKRYSDFKKLHSDLAYTHRNLFRRMEDFPSFPRAQVFGRFEPEVIEERRKAAEIMLRFTVHIPALNNSPQLKEFFRGGEGRKPSESFDLPPLPPPLIPAPPEAIEAGEDALRSVPEAEFLDIKPERSQTPETDNQGPNAGSPVLPIKSNDDEALDALFAYGGEDEEEKDGAPSADSPHRCPLSVQELALFDPFSAQDSGAGTVSHGEELAALDASDCSPARSLMRDNDGEAGGYLSLAIERIQRASESEVAHDYQEAFRGYRSGVDLLLQGMQGDPNEARREAVKKKTAEYLQRAEEIFQQHLKHLEL